MDLKEVLRMTAGDAATSYAANSTLQGEAIEKARPVVQQSVEELISSMPHGAQQQLVVADLGCSFGPNAFAVISEVLDAVGESCRKLRRHRMPEIQFFMNDLPANDFNSIFRSLASYKKKAKEEKGEELAGRLYVAGVAGSFYDRLFPSNSVHLFHSSSSVHWLSQVPEGLKDEHNNELNKGNVYVATTSPPCVREAYLKQFQKDFSRFLGCRSEELQDGGHMVLTIIVERSSLLLSDLISEVLKSMADEGIIKEADIDAFNIPLYNPLVEEVRGVIIDQGEFEVVQESFMESCWDGLAEHEASRGKLPNPEVRGKSAARVLRAAMETVYAQQFGKENMDVLFTKIAGILTREFEKGEDFMCTFYVITLKRNNAT